MDDEPQTLDTTPTGRRNRRDRLRRWTLSWAAIVLTCVAVVIGSAIGLATSEQSRTVPVVVFTAMALLAAVVAIMVTFARARAGSILGEGELAQPPARGEDPTLERDDSGEVIGRHSPDDVPEKERFPRAHGTPDESS